MIVEYFTYNQLPQCQRTKYFNIVIYNNRKIKYLTYFNKYKKLIKNNKVNKNKYINAVIKYIKPPAPNIPSPAP